MRNRRGGQQDVWCVDLKVGLPVRYREAKAAHETDHSDVVRAHAERCRKAEVVRYLVEDQHANRLADQERQEDQRGGGSEVVQDDTGVTEREQTEGYD